jgi:POT family proton-dependent oligopeptide transporter
MLKNHPRGLMVLFFTEMWERFGFYTLMAILYLYMEESLGWGDKRKGDYYGIFLGMVYFIPLLGGFLGDRVLGQRNTIRLGAILMMFGYVALTFSSLPRIALFYAGLVLVGVGTGLFKANISVLVGNLYEEGSKHKDAAFNIFYMGVNLGATLAPLAATLIGKYFHSYNLSFAAAAVGMVVSMIIFQLGSRHIVPAPVGGLKTTPSDGQMPAATSRNEDWQRITSLLTLFVIVAFFWVAFYQNGSSLTLFAKRSTKLYEWLQPETYQVFNPFFILVLTPVLVAFFARLREKGSEPSSASKILAGMIAMSLSMLIMVFASLAGGDRDEGIMSPAWLISSYFVVTVSEILVSPMGLSFVSKVSPQRMRGLMMGGWFAATAFGGFSSGWLGKYYGPFTHETMLQSEDAVLRYLSQYCTRLDHHDFFLVIAALPFLSALLVLPFLKRLNRFSR